ncbi:hypothetical protein TCAL_00103 [Tigriopus californicus]|uniref:Cyclic nucleotide phosphodiesterase catalytic domain-containing protein n=2 Tax=Tigriopus californicus TaxID=6832 RepID=A0A553PHY5_TIGCA|nr:uncharacterized protein LOC131880903 isoform X2 [Tigriopus californicus]XP_059083610.1 uncharacterized protein LOC131880903 isoform X2 [Tigriopus californicus]XP_059083611.1 uncharacterized protein LOC131880903 isoform X2 [Tigriopus californicus]XP_059083612.1 uncharacterized protein LOC131880903 isoform X2 [Tigriopus californicus]XP_059083613.1 uncharacterized protein LOC131880903 isoform X2 [Tigriopus californicus]XP_059083614.1 uncharacterized protein LOC131880903 isoform X2 [Tigriopus c|eukprot:TCALIF_00103-PA protein Name:"Similar to CNP 2',3'-cyclic-nucleotide 3'-phosphodiesterase (Bos taurus)" AED:0.24 eAED:0.25 QI:0/-1/0/1/-1/1/1/0/377
MGQAWSSVDVQPQTDDPNPREPGSWTQIPEVVTRPYQRLKGLYFRSFEAPIPVITFQNSGSQTTSWNSTFLEHQPSIEFFHNNRILILLRSPCLATRQKMISAIAQSWEPQPIPALISGVEEHLKKADKQCRVQARAAFKAGQSPVVIDQGHLKPWGVVALYKSVQFWDYHVIVWEDGLQRFTPAYFAFFLGLSGSQNLWEWTQKVLIDGRRISDHSFPDLTDLSRDRFAAASRNIMHCTMKFCGKMQGSAYVDRQNVIDHIGRVEDLEIIGLVVTSRSVGAKVRLITEQTMLYEADDTMGGGEGSVDGCHISIGTTGNHRPKVIGQDMKSAAQVEREVTPTTFDLEIGVLKKFSTDLWVVSLHQSLRFPALFTGSV